MRTTAFLWIGFLVCGLTFNKPAKADVPPPIAEAKGKTGAFTASLSKRSPMSNIAEIARRVSIPEEKNLDYDLSVERFDLYLPKEADEQGKYGLIISTAEQDGVPTDFPAVLEKGHLIWIGAERGRDKSIPAKIGIMLDEAYNASQTFPIDDRRIYVFSPSPMFQNSAAALYYPEVFTGAIYTERLPWFGEARVGTAHVTMNLPKPDDKSLALARKQSRFFMAQRDTESRARMNLGGIVLDGGYKKSGFEHVTIQPVPGDQIGNYTAMSGDWFAQGVSFLDSSLAVASKASEQKPSAPSTAATESKSKSAQPATNGSTPAPVNDASSSDAAAARAIALAKSYISAKRYDAARTRLESLIKSYPDSSAAKDAKALLQEIQGK